ncbi:MAG TPA: tRNA pseudouridine(55) synthase TruB [Coxiellaceae bacterium]|nr:MAG: tRNA pseudouridine(55) synthase TruB [Gammaproteobacteria bacterium RBG_16_37_9]HBC71187.1 tRNA pseudouridine(55) synthase TruB [Coxiellaceae bacterium]
MKRNISGILLLDKPVGFTSNEALQTVKKIFSANKAGHTGSLDPNASGMLPICFGEATKFSQFLLEANKRYLVTGKLGETTASGDSECEIIEKRIVKDIGVKSFERILPKFRGKISQLPPMYSAIKHKGQPLYKLARQGIEIKRDSREINIYELQLLDFKNDLAEFDIYCSKGTYVRTLIVDIGEELGCGAHVVALRRLVVGPYQAEQMVSLDKLQELALVLGSALRLSEDDIMKKNYKELDKFLLPIESMLLDMPEIALTQDMVYYMSLGQAVLVPYSPSPGWVKLKSKDGKFLGVGEVMLDGKVTPRKMVTGRL